MCVDTVRLMAAANTILSHSQRATLQHTLAAQVYDSGIPFSIVRLGAPPNDSAPAPGAVELTSAGDTSKSAQLTRFQACGAHRIWWTEPGLNEICLPTGCRLQSLARVHRQTRQHDGGSSGRVVASTWPRVLEV